MRKARLILLGGVLAAVALPAARSLTAWFSMRAPEVLATDYARYCVSALQGLRSGWSRLYDLDAQHQIARSLEVPFFLPNVYTPAMSLFIVPFTRLSIENGFLIWSALLLSCLLVCWRLLAPGDSAARAVQLAILFLPYPVMLGLRHGQVIPVQMALVAVSYRLLQQGHEWPAGAALCAVVLKPQGLLLVPFALAAAGRRRAFAGWAVATAAISVAILALVGLHGLEAYLDRLRWAQAHPIEMMVAWSYTLARRFESPVARAAVLAAAAALTLIAAWRHRKTPEIVFAAGLIGSVVASPYTHLYDFMLLFPAAWFTLRVVPAKFAVPPLLVCYLFMLLSTHEGPGARWVLLCECVWLCALAVMPGPGRTSPRTARSTQVASPG